MTWEESFERDKHMIARAVHEAWAAEKLKQGFADHAWQPIDDEPSRAQPKYCARCGSPKHVGWYPDDVPHHPDMLDYADLSPEIQEYDIVTARIVYPLAFRAGQDSAPPAERSSAAGEEAT